MRICRCIFTESRTPFKCKYLSIRIRGDELIGEHQIYSGTPYTREKITCAAMTTVFDAKFVDECLNSNKWRYVDVSYLMVD